MRPTSAIAACAVCALATVFSVQQGEHGPLVVYKLHAPTRPVPAAPVAPPADMGSVLPSRAPAVLGTVVMPAGGFVPPAQATANGATDRWEASDFVTLQQVSDDLIWRRETADRLPELPFAPRF